MFVDGGRLLKKLKIGVVLSVEVDARRSESRLERRQNLAMADNLRGRDRTKCVDEVRVMKRG